jgi:hypothetical protein
MVGRTKLIRTTGSPLIGGWTRRKKPVWPWVVAGAVAIAAIAFAVWYFVLR